MTGYLAHPNYTNRVDPLNLLRVYATMLVFIAHTNIFSNGLVWLGKSVFYFNTPAWRQCGFFILFPGFWQVKVLQVRDIHSHHPILESIIIKKYFGFGCPLCCLFLLLVYLSTQIFCQPILLLLKIFSMHLWFNLEQSSG